MIKKKNLYKYVAARGHVSVRLPKYGCARRHQNSFYYSRSNTDIFLIICFTHIGFRLQIFTSLVLCPTELVKIRMQGGADGKPKRGPRLSQVVKNIWKVDGFKGLFRGMGSTMARECISCPVFFGAYEWARERLKPAGGRKEDCSPAATMASGSAAGLLMWLTVYPIDVIKSRLQMSTGNGNRLRSVADEIRSAGVRGLFCGLWPTLVKSVPVTGVLLFGVEFSKPVFRKYLFRNASAPERPDGDGDERPTDGIFSFCDFVSGWTAG